MTIEERVEAAAKMASKLWGIEWEPMGDDFARLMKQDTFCVLRAAFPEIFDELLTHKIVPVEPTEKMIDKARAVTASWLDIQGSGLTIAREKMRRRYRAMIDEGALAMTSAVR